MDSRNKLIDQLTNLIDDGIRKAKYATYDEWQKAISSIVASYNVVYKPPALCPRCGSESQVMNSDLDRVLVWRHGKRCGVVRCVVCEDTALVR